MICVFSEGSLSPLYYPNLSLAVKRSRTIKLFQIELRQLIGFIISVHDSKLQHLIFILSA